MSKLYLLAAAAAMTGAVATAAPAQKDSAPVRGNDCVFIRSVRDFQPLDRTKVIVWTTARRDGYLMELSFPLTDLKWAHRLAFVDRNNDGRVCGFGMDRVVVPNSTFDQPSTIMGMKRLDAQMIAQLEQQYEVSLTRKKKNSQGEVEEPQGDAQPAASTAQSED